MQVTSTADHITHAVIKAGETMEFSVSDDPMFFQMLSSTLYTRQTEAMVRETICNAWDAHIEAGKENTPIQITLDKDFLTIRDFGPGIPHDKIKPIYLVYGKSTKADSSNQTGGFGLGCKAPFAYTDHFEVRSYHAGTCTIYTMSKASLEHGGRPAASVVTSIPTTETGLQVRIPLKSEYSSTQHTRGEIAKLIRDLVYLGGMKVLFANGTLNETEQLEQRELETMALDTKPGSFLISVRIREKAGTANRIYVRYGSVVYPVQEHDDYADQYHSAISVLKASTNSDYASIVFQAGPDSICIPPSRESISMMPLTIETMKALFTGFTDGFEEAYKERAKTMVLETLHKIRDDPANNGLSLFSNNPRSYLGSDYSRNSNHVCLNGSDNIITQEQMVDMAVRIRLPNKSNFLHFVTKERLQVMVDKKLIHQHQARAFFTACQCNLQWTADHFVQKELFNPLVKKIINIPELDIKQLGVCQSTQWSSNREVVPYADMRSIDFEKALFYMRNTIVLSYNKKAVVDLINQNNFLVYIVPITKTVIANIRQHFANMRGFSIVDLTIDQDKERVERLANKRKEAAAQGRKPGAKKEGYLCSNYCIRKNRNNVIYNDFTSITDNRIENPKWVERKPTKSEFGRNASMTQLVRYLSTDETKIIMSVIGDSGAITVSEAQFKKLSGEKKLPNAITYAAKFYLNWLTKNEERLSKRDCLKWDTLVKDPTTKKLCSSFDLHQRRWFTLVRDYNCLAEYYGLVSNVKTTEQDELMDQLHSVLCDNERYITNTTVMSDISIVMARIKASKGNPNAKKVLEAIATSSVLGFLDREKIIEGLENKKTMKQTAAFMIKSINHKK